MGQFVPKGQESRRHRKGLQWTKEDDAAVEEHIKLAKEGKCGCIPLTDELMEEMKQKC